MTRKSGGRLHSALRKAFAVAALAIGVGQAAPAFAEGKKADFPPSPEITAMETELNAYIKDHKNPFYNHVIVLDPAAFDARVGAGEAPLKAMRKMLADDGFKNPDADTVEALAVRMITPAKLPSGEPVFFSSPGGVPVPDKKLFILTPAAGNMIPALPSFPFHSLQANIDGINEHEKWHAKDAIDNADDITLYREIISILPPASLLNMPGALVVLSSVTRRETLGDVGGFGDMVRKKGYDLSLIDQQADWRERRAAEDGGNDLQHCSTLALRDLKNRIVKMGLQAFRAMDDTAAEKLYIDVASNNGLSRPGALRAFLIRTFGSEDEIDRIRELAKTDADAHAGINSYVMWRGIYTPPALGEDSADNRADALLAGKLDAGKALEVRARAENHGRADRTAISKTYAEMQGELRDAESLSPDNVLYLTEAAKLRTAFLSRTLSLKLVQDDDGLRVERTGQAAPKRAAPKL